MSYFEVTGSKTSDSVQKALSEHKKIAIRGGEWIIDKTIRLTSDTEVLIDGAKLTLADDMTGNMFTTENFFYKSIGELKNIEIHGTNGAVLDGGKYNGLSEKNSGKDGRPHIINNTMLMFYNTSGLSVHDIKITNHRYWGITNLFVDNAEYRNIEFKADLSRFDENGVHYPDELPQNYMETYIKNADGIDLRIGCRNFVIENITGFTEDDTVALTALAGETSFEYPLLVSDKSTDICNVKIRKIHSDCYYTSNVRLLCGNGRKIHDVEIDDIRDTRTTDAYSASSTVRLGDMAYAKSPAKVGDMSNITVKNVISKAKFGVTVSRALSDTIIKNIESEKTPFSVFGEAEMHNVSILL